MTDIFFMLVDEDETERKINTDAGTKQRTFQGRERERKVKQVIIYARKRERKRQQMTV